MNEIKLLNNPASLASFKLVSNELIGAAGNKEVRYYRDGKHLVIYEITRGKTRDTEYQTELPISSLGWLKNTILKGFWTSPSEGGLPKDQHRCSAQFDNEDIVLSRSMNAGDYEKSGFKIVNKSRKSHILPSWPQEFQITDERVEKVLLPLFDKLGVN